MKTWDSSHAKAVSRLVLRLIFWTSRHLRDLRLLSKKPDGNDRLKVGLWCNDGHDESLKKS